MSSHDWEMLIRLLLAAFLGGIVGIERGSGDRPAGFRTHILVCAGAALFMLVSMLWSDFGYISCFFLPYVHFSHHSFLNFLCCGLFLDIYLSICSIMSNFTINSYLLSLTTNYFWTYFSQLPCLCPITCPYLKMI